MERIDLHVHTLASDGSDAPETVVRSDRPMATMSFDSTSTSPPSME